MKRIQLRVVLPVLVVLAAVGSGAAYAATRTTAKPIGTGVVVVDTTLADGGGSAAGTGIVLTSSGEVLTNNHVIAGSANVRVVVPSTNRTYSARVVGYSTSADVAVLQLQNASNLKTVTVGNAGALRVGAHVTAVGNAGGTGSLTSANGTVTGLRRTITAENDNGGAEQLSGLIETNAPLRPGDSGGPLLNSAGRVVGIDTAGSTGFSFTGYSPSDGYAVPIGKALAVAKAVVSGKSSATVHVGATAFLGVEVQTAPYFEGGGAAIVGVVTGSPAAVAGLVPGDVITAADAKAVTSAGSLGPIVLARKPGAKITITYTDTSGATQTASVTLASGPPQ
jgi:S1-C subfamily serine protease